MANCTRLKPFILSWEGGFANVKGDRGGATNKGITISTWKAQGYDNDGDGDIDVTDLKLMTDQQWTQIFKRNYWDRWHADDIRDQSLANTLVDWVWGSGKWGITIPQQELGVLSDGIVGSQTIAALNRQDPQKFFARLQERRKRYLERLVANDPSQKKFLKGWLNRLNSIQYGRLVCSNQKIITF